MKEYLSSVLAAAFSALLLTPASAEHEWSVNGSFVENDLWTLTASWSNGSLTLAGATPKVDGLTTLDVSEMNIGGKALSTFNCWNGKNISSIKKLIIPDRKIVFNIQDKGIPSLEELCTPNEDHPHQLSISSWNGGIVSSAALAGDYQIVDVSTFGKKTFYETKINNVTVDGTFSSLDENAFLLCYDLKSAVITTTGNITSLPKQLCGYWGNQSSTASPSPCQLRSLTINGVVALRSPAITSIGYASIANCVNYSDIIDLPNCTYIDEYGLRGNSSIPFVNLMSATTVKRATFRDYTSLDRVVFGSKDPLTIGIELFCAAFTASANPCIIWNSTTAPSGIAESMFWNIDNYHLTNYVRKEARAGWDTAVAGIPKMKQNFVSMDTAFKVNLRLDDKVVMTTLMPGVSGENSVWTIPAGWFLEAGKTFGEGTVKDAGGTVIDGAKAIPDNTGLNLTITLPASCVASVDGTTQDDEVFVDMVAQDNKDPQITVSIVDGAGNEVVANSFEATVGTSVTKDYGVDVFGDSEYYFNNVLSLVVDPVDAAAATFGIDAKLTLVNIAKDATVSIKIDRAARPAQLAHWNVDAGNYTMSDGVWTFRCDFTGGKAVIADAIGYNGADLDVAEVDFTKPIGTDGSSDYQVTTLDWGASINGSAVQIKADNQCGKNVVINGGLGSAATLVGVLKIPDTVESIAGWGYCANLTIDPASLVQIRKFGKYALARSSITGALTLSGVFPVEVGDYAFEMCSKLTALKIPSLGSTLGEKAFYYCYGMKTVELEGVTSIKWAAFARENSGAWAIERVVFSPALTNIGANAFYKSTKNGCVFDAVLPKDMPGAKSGDGVIAVNVFQDIGAGSIVIPFKGTCTIGGGSFHYSYTTNFVFWGKAPTTWAHETGAEFNENVSNIFRTQFNGNVKTDRIFTVSLAIDQAGWESVATKLKKDCTDDEWAALNPPGTAFGWVMAAEKADGTNQKRIWLCEGTSPWESVVAPGLKIIIR